MRKRAATPALLAVVLAFGALAADTIPPELEARAAELRRQASPQMLAWVHDQGLTLARKNGPSTSLRSS